MTKIQSLYNDYAELELQIKELVTLKESYREKILKDLVSRGVKTEKHGLGSFTVSYLKKWSYPESVTKLEDKFKQAKAKAQSTGDAIYTEEESLKFTIIKI